MRFIYLDTGLRTELGHHAVFCRNIITECRAREISTGVFAHREITKELASELGGVGFFQAYTYNSYDSDPLISWLTSFQRMAATTREDLQGLAELDRGDIVYMNWAWPAQLMALMNWLAALPPEQQPTVFVEVGADPGLEADTTPGRRAKFRPRDPRLDPRALLYRYAVRDVAPSATPRLHLIAFDRTTASAFQDLLDRPVRALPIPLAAARTPRSRVGKRPITISVLGHQRPGKGYVLMPDIAAALLKDDRDIWLLVQNAEPSLMAAAQAALRSIAGENDRLSLEERSAGPRLWAELLARSDLVLCPYSPNAYLFAHSSIVSESLANAIPVVVPAQTAPASLLEQWGSPGVTFPSFNALSIAEAVKGAVADFDRYAQRAHEVAQRWDQSQGPVRLVDAFVGIAGTT
jgi:hypothetical protein